MTTATLAARFAAMPVGSEDCDRYAYATGEGSWSVVREAEDRYRLSISDTTHSPAFEASEVFAGPFEVAGAIGMLA